MDNDDQKSKAIEKQEAAIIMRPILLGIFGFIAFFASISVALMFDSMGAGSFVSGILITVWALIVGTLAIVFLLGDLRKMRRTNEDLEEGTENKFLQLSYYLNIVILVGVIIGCFIAFF